MMLHTGDAIPAALVTKMKDASEFGKGYGTQQQIFYAFLSLQLYTNTQPASLDTTELTKQLQLEVCPRAMLCQCCCCCCRPHRYCTHVTHTHTHTLPPVESLSIFERHPLPSQLWPPCGLQLQLLHLPVELSHRLRECSPTSTHTTVCASQ